MKQLASPLAGKASVSFPRKPQSNDMSFPRKRESRKYFQSSPLPTRNTVAGRKQPGLLLPQE